MTVISIPYYFLYIGAPKLYPMKETLLCFSLLAISAYSFSQQTIDVTEQTIKVGAMKTEEMYFGFAEGDQVIFNFQEADKKEIKEIEIVEWPNTSKFSDFKTTKIDNKTLNVSRTAVYKFRFYNGAITGRICRIKIQRIAANDALKNFNTNVNWVNRQDTTWNSYTKDVIAGYDTAYEQKTKKELVKSERNEELVLDKTQRVHSTTNENGNKTWLLFDLPRNEFFENKTKTVIAWAYWVGVGEEANAAWQQNEQAMKKLTQGVTSYFTTPLGGLAAGAVFDLLTPKLGEDVYYAVTDETNKSLFMAGQNFRLFDRGKGVAGYRKFTDKSLCQGRLFICLSNDNLTLGINASVKVVAIVETNYYQDKTFTDQKVTPRYEKKIFKDPIISTAKVPITGSL